MAWYITEGINSGYPWEESFPLTFQIDFTSDSSHRYPDSIWRIGSSNNGYPFQYWWFKEVASDTGDMSIGGGQTNYPGGFTTGNFGGINDQFNDDDMAFNTDLIEDINAMYATALDSKMLGLSAGDLQRIIGYINTPDSQGFTYDPTYIQRIYGANIYDGILVCRMYPFDVLLNDDIATCYPEIFGVYRLYEVAQVLPPTDPPTYNPVPETAVHKASRSIRQFLMGSLSLDIFQAWEVENISYYIYLPCAGVFPLDVRDGSSIDVTLFVDILSGIGEYIVRQNGQITSIYKINMGVDVPINLSQGQISSNHTAFVTNQMARIAGVAAPIAGAINPMLGMGIGVASSAISQMAGQQSNIDVSSPSVGAGVGMASYPYARIIAKIPKMFNDGYGFHETQGVNRSTTYVNLSTCSGFVKCKNYKSDIIVATEDEKREIEALMDSGVFL